MDAHSDYMHVAVYSAAHWAVTYLGSEAYAGRPLDFVVHAYQIANVIRIITGPTVEMTAVQYALQTDQVPPLGSFVFYDRPPAPDAESVSPGAIHVGLAIADGKVVHVWGPVRIDDYRAIEQLPAEEGGAPLRYIGYAPPEAILEDHTFVGYPEGEWPDEDFTDDEEALLEHVFGEEFFEGELYGLTDWLGERPLSRTKRLAAEIFGYGYDHYADRSGNPRFGRMMTKKIKALERAEADDWPDSRLASLLDVPEEKVPVYRRRYHEAKEIVDAPTPAASFLRGVRLSIRAALREGLEDEAAVERLVTQIGHRAADLGYLLTMRREVLLEYAQELRAESEGAYGEEAFRQADLAEGQGEDEEEDQDDGGSAEDTDSAADAGA